jgi:hypothetical protein
VLGQEDFLWFALQKVKPENLLSQCTFVFKTVHLCAQQLIKYNTGTMINLAPDLPSSDRLWTDRWKNFEMVCHI